jgi:hypothetical protein
MKGIFVVSVMLCLSFQSKKRQDCGTLGCNSNHPCSQQQRKPSFYEQVTCPRSRFFGHLEFPVDLCLATAVLSAQAAEGLISG